MSKALALVLWSTVALAQANPELEKANRFLFDQKFADAAKALEAASKVQGNGREVVTRIYELQGIVHGQLGQATKAREAFQALLSLDPKRELNGKHNTKVVAAFSAAKEWANANSPLKFEAAKAALDEKGKVMQLAAKVKSDSMRLTRKVRFHLRADEAKWQVQDSELQGTYAAANTDAMGVEWWAELLGENDRVLMLVGSEAAPQREGKVKDKPAPVVVGDAPKRDEAPPPESKVEPTQPPQDKRAEQIVDEAPASSSGALRPLGYVLMGVGLAGVGVGTAFGVQSSAARSRIVNATKDSQDRVTGLTQREAFLLEPQAKSQALIANVLFGVGGGVALLGGIFWLVGGSSPDASVAVSPTLGGVVVSGTY